MATGRGAESTANTTASGQNQQYFDNSQNSYSAANQDLGDFSKQLEKYQSSNPYGTGGADQTATNEALSSTAGGMARSAGQALQSQALRTGGNTSGGIAATEQMEQQGQRDLGSQEASANQQRIAQGAAYNLGGLQASEFPAQEEATLAGQQAGAGNTAEGTAVDAAKTPSFGDQWGQMLINTTQHALTGQ